MKQPLKGIAVVLCVLTVITSIGVVGYAAYDFYRQADSPLSADKASGASKLAAQPQPDRLMLHTVGMVNHIEKTSIESDSISLQWDEVPGVDGYSVYVSNRDNDESFVKVDDVKEPEITVEDLDPTTEYWFRVSCYEEVNGMMYEGPATIKKTATQPETASNYTLFHSSDVIEFSWSKVDRATGYEIFRSCSKTNNEYELYITIPDNQVTYFEDQDVDDGELYSYSVRPYRVLYGDAEYHARHSIFRAVCGLAAPTNVIASSISSRVMLSWNRSDWATGYNIYVAEEASDDAFEYLDATGSNLYTTGQYPDGKNLWFRIQPYRILQDGEEVVGTYTTCQATAQAARSKANVAGGDGTYIEISIEQQHMWFYKDNSLVLDTDVVTGNADGTCNTPTGRYSVQSRATNTTLEGPGYSSFVNYWMGFNGGIGIHDASWRSSFGGTIYKGNGSHGCVNTPYDKVKIIYENTSYGTPVIVY